VWIFLAAMMAALVAPPAQAAATTTTLALSSSSVISGTVVTFTAAVSNGSPVTLGTVTFCNAAATYCDNSAVMGTAQLTSAGTAVIKLVPGVGSHSYKAVFSATTANAASASSAQALTVTGPAQYPTTTTFSSSGSSGNYTFTGAVFGLGNLNAAPAGTVSFLDTSHGNSVVASATLGAGTLAQTFAPQVAYAAGTNVYWVAVGDFNGDGILDLAVANSNDNTVGVLVGNGDGTFQTEVPYSAGNGAYTLGAARIP
jgi:hypothetical protein